MKPTKTRTSGQRGGWVREPSTTRTSPPMATNAHNDDASAVESWEDRDDGGLVLVNVSYDTSALGSLRLRVVRQEGTPSPSSA